MFERSFYCKLIGQEKFNSNFCSCSFASRLIFLFSFEAFSQAHPPTPMGFQLQKHLTLRVVFPRRIFVLVYTLY